MGDEHLSTISETESDGLIKSSVKNLVPIPSHGYLVISVSSYSSEESVGTSTGRVILFGTIPTTIPDTTPSMIPPSTHIDTTPIPIVSPTIPPSPDYTPHPPDFSPHADTEVPIHPRIRHQITYHPD
ncbi:hypothetical protein Tco_0679318 [Tanacetum coccineum]|uniref:Uncharacterized protein n=1 Tax=Tanacetum coccineum TaxID=301880 RepID=A0ABQ4XHR9_9ASTR